VDLEILRGEFLAVMGPSGSGKSTLMNLLGCLDSPTSGSYNFKGIEVEMLNKDQRSLIRRHALGFIFQGFNLLARTSALENVELPLLYRGYSRKERHDRAREALARVGLVNKERNTPAELSGGQQQRVAIARAIVTNPDTLFADEPTGNLDSKTTHEIMELLDRLNTEQGISIIMVTHEEDVASHAKRIIHVIDGLISENPIHRTAKN
jgi:putative ABC transport system ATP-binding protein